MVANDPALIAIACVKELQQKEIENEIKFEDCKWAYRPLSVVSVGTGYNRKPIDGLKAKKFGVIEWFKEGHLINILNDQSLVTEIFKIMLEQKDDFIRVDGDLKFKASSKMDNTYWVNIEHLRRNGHEWWSIFGDRVLEMLKR